MARSNLSRQTPTVLPSFVSVSSLLHAMTMSLVAILLTVRYFLPTESAAQGETLWIVALWIIAAIVRGILIVTVDRRNLACSYGKQDYAFLILVVGQVVSSIILVVAGSGERRTAVNMAWEWIGLGLSWFVLRSLFEDRLYRNGVVQALIVTGVVLAGLGVWQHLVELPQLAAEYGPLFDRLATASGEEALSIQQKLTKAGIPLDGPGRTLFEKRLRDSREPVGLFGLANNLGGVLAACLVLYVGALLFGWKQTRKPRWSQFISYLFLGVLVWCLLLTKSRTAWCGTACGLGWIIVRRVFFETAGKVGSALRSGSESVQQPRQSVPTPTFLDRLLRDQSLDDHRRRGLFLVLSSFVLLGMIVAALTRFGGLDRQVLTEASKSLGYRMQYWRATTQLVSDHFLLGIGPGNFRQHYLKYKLPEASEEISDPHNLFLDVASSGGVFPLIGLIGWICMTVFGRQHAPFPVRFESRKTDGARSTKTTSGKSNTEGSDVGSSYDWISGIGLVMAFAGTFVTQGHWDDRPLVLAAIWFAVAWLARFGVFRDSHRDDFGEESLQAAYIAVVVHLLGAGGIAMPAMGQLLVVLASGFIAAERANRVDSLQFPESVEPADREPRPLFHRSLPIVSALLLFGFLLSTALIPVSRATRYRAQGKSLLITIEGRKSADDWFHRACEADDWSSDSFQDRAELAMEHVMRDQFHSNSLFERAVQSRMEAIRRDPVSFHGPRQLGNLWLARWKVTRQSSDIQQAVEWLRKGVNAYPTNSAMLAELATALRSSGEINEAMEFGKRALIQDELNHRLGHVDRYLTETTVDDMKQITGGEMKSF